MSRAHSKWQREAKLTRGEGCKMSHNINELALCLVLAACSGSPTASNSTGGTISI